MKRSVLRTSILFITNYTDSTTLATPTADALLSETAYSFVGPDILAQVSKECTLAPRTSSYFARFL